MSRHSWLCNLATTHISETYVYIHTAGNGDGGLTDGLTAPLPWVSGIGASAVCMWSFAIAGNWLSGR